MSKSEKTFRDTMTFENLEHIYELMAQSLDQVGEEKHALFLSKLSLTLAHEIGDVSVVEEAIKIAQQDME